MLVFFSCALFQAHQRLILPTLEHANAALLRASPPLQPEMASSFQVDKDTEAKILRQVEYYFSDKSLLKDQFLLPIINESEDGLVSLALISSFSRMRNFLGLKESDADKVPSEVLSKVAEILRKSTFLRISDDGLKVGRASKLLNPEAMQAEVDACSFVAKPLPWNVTLNEVESFFSQFAKVKSVRLYQHPGTEVFSGVAVIEMWSEEEAHKVLEMKLVFEGAELELQHRKDLNQSMQCRFSPANEMQQVHNNGKMSAGGYRNERMAVEQGEDFPKGVIVSFKLEKLQLYENNNLEVERNSDGAFVDEASNEERTDSSKGVRAKNASAVSADQKSEGEKCTDSSKEVSDMGVLAREDIKEVLGAYGTIKYVDFSRGDTSGYVRFESSDAVKKARAAVVLAGVGGFMIKTSLLRLEVVEGEAEEAYWKKLKSSGGGRRFDNRRRGRGRYGFGGLKGRGGGVRDDIQPITLGKHNRFEQDNETCVPSKVQKTE